MPRLLVVFAGAATPAPLKSIRLLVDPLRYSCPEPVAVPPALVEIICPVADTIPVFVFPPVTLPVTLTKPPVKLATFTILVNMPLLATRLPVTLADPPVTKLLPVKLPVLDTNPVTDNPSVANIAMLGLAATFTTTLPLLNTRTLLVPFDMAAESIPVSCDPLPKI